MNNFSIGIDLVDIERFRTILTEDTIEFITNTFSDIEQDYCNSYADPAPHYAGTFAAKEAIRKTSKDFHLQFSELEIRRAQSGKPEVWINGQAQPLLSISITHSKESAAAVALYQ